MRRFSSRLRSTSTVAAIASLTAIALLVPTAASADPIGTIQQVSTFSPTSNFTTCGSTSVASNGGVTLAAWAGPTSGPVSASVNVALLGVGGVAGPTVTYQPSDSTPLAQPSNCEPISVDAGANGGFLVTWNDASTDGAIYGVLVSSTGAFIGGAFAVSSNTNYIDTETVTAAWSPADSRYLVTWKTRVDSAFPGALGSQQLVGRFIDGAGAPIGADFLVTNFATQVNDSQDVAYGGGTWVVVGVGNNDGVLRAVTVSASGVVSAPIAVPSPTTSTTGPSVEFNAVSGQFLIVSRDASPWGQLLQPSGALVGAPFTISTNKGSRPRVTAIGADGWLVAWHGAGGADVSGIEVSTAGAPVGAPAVISAGANSAAVESNFRPELAFSAATGEAYVVWSRRIAAAGQTNVFARAWFVAAPAPVVVPAAEPTLVVTGVDSDRAMVSFAVGGLALLAGMGALVIRRRRMASADL